MGWFDHILKQLISLEIFLPFIPLFVAFNALGILPIFVSLTSEMNQPERKRVAHQSILTGFLVSLGFLAVGKSVFVLLGITVSDFQIAGGILLFNYLHHRLDLSREDPNFSEGDHGSGPHWNSLDRRTSSPHPSPDHYSHLWLPFNTSLPRFQLCDCLAYLQSIPQDHATHERRGSKRDRKSLFSVIGCLRHDDDQNWDKGLDGASL
jgi:hypothetical protein